MWPIEKRVAGRRTTAFVTPETVDLLGQKMMGIIADRRVTKVHRYLGENRGAPDVRVGLRVWDGGYGGPTSIRPGQSASVRLASRRHLIEGISINVCMPNEDESAVRDRYHHPEKNWLGERREITLVELDGWPGSPSSEDQIRVEHWNEHGVGRETLLVFDDVDPVQELFWDAKGDTERRVWMDNEFCTVHERHLEDPEHKYIPDCATRRATLAENLRAIAVIAEREAS